MRSLLARPLLVCVLLFPSLVRATPQATGPFAHVYRVVGDDSLLAYVFYPSGTGRGRPTNAILLFHGGGWVAGSAEWTFATAERFAWARKSAKDLGIAGKVAGYGVSAGGHLLALTATLGCGVEDSRPDADAMMKVGGVCELNVYAGVGHLLTRNLSNQEDDYDPDPEKRAQGIEKQRAFLVRLGFIGAP